MGTLELDAEGCTIETLIAEALGASPGLAEYLRLGGKLRTDITILINGRHCMFMEGLETRLKDGDRVDVLLPMIGG